MNAVCANASRLFKYLIPDYYEQFRRTVVNWAASVFTSEQADEMAITTLQQRVHGLRLLYGDAVLPHKLLVFFPLHWQHPHAVECEDIQGSGKLSH